jgi:hypothetical protein
MKTNFVNVDRWLTMLANCITLDASEGNQGSCWAQRCMWVMVIDASGRCALRAVILEPYRCGCMQAKQQPEVFTATTNPGSFPAIA